MSENENTFSGGLSVHEIKSNIEQHLAALLQNCDGKTAVGLAMQESVLGQGKRIRPLMMLLIAHDLGYAGEKKTLLDLACAVEIIHSASLILDDIPCMDNADMRRGKPTIHKKYGESVAILAAIGLLTRAFALVSSTSGLSGEQKALAVSELANAVGEQGLVLGQFRDLAGVGQSQDINDITATNELKTGVLFIAMLQVIGLTSHANEATRQRLSAFATDFGQLFQLLDDLSDSHYTTGKDRNKDAGKPTLVNVMGRDHVCDRVYHHFHSANEHLDAIGVAGQETRRFIHALLTLALAGEKPAMKIA
ncbi:polyprenyl synthetase family protein [Atlantibacter sp.]|uniref:polyprenyl synthetase family protein n=1 Tax=Atlantibacter sp. TaxID=1903473 RepID=UPI002896FDB7|nr:polyprenyl synthetase family protein [Atlantibacter sp.]